MMRYFFRKEQKAVKLRLIISSMFLQNLQGLSTRII